MRKTLVRFFGGAVMVCGSWLGLPASAHAQSFDIVADTQDGSVREPLAQVVHVTNVGQLEATNVTVTFRAPKGAKVDCDCQVEHFPGGLRSYTYTVGSLAPGQKADVTFLFSMTRSGDYGVIVQVIGDVASAATLLQITIS
jgi:hypothetical protein